MMINYRMCSNCVMDTSDAAIEFDINGVCDHCNTYRHKIAPNWRTDETGMRELERQVTQIRREGRGRSFDCLIGLSGGIDSSYLTYLAATDFGLRPLVFHVDTGWNSQESANNVEKLVDTLGLELHTDVINWDEMRDLQLAFFKSGVPHIDAPQDHAIFATMYRFAEENRIKSALTGANYSTEAIRNPVEWMYYQSDSTQLVDIHNRFGERDIRTFPTTSILRHKVYLRYVKGIRVRRLLDLVPFVKADAIKLLTERIGWQEYPQKHFESRFTRFYEGYWLPTRFGYDTRRVQYSSLILTDQMTRSDAIKRLQEPAYDKDTIDREFSYVATKLGISVDDLRLYHDAPKRTHRDYRSQHWLYTVGARAMRMLRLEFGGKR